MAELAFLGRVAGYQPYFIGFSQWDELTHGVDSSYSVGARIGFFQFKRGYQKMHFFTFYINNNAPHFNQHRTLSRTDASCGGACRYVFPLIGTNQDVYRHRGNLLALTPFFPPRVFDPLSPARRRHRVRVYGSGIWRRYSELKQGEWRNMYGYLPEETPSLDKLLAHSPGGREEMAGHIIDGLQLPLIRDLVRETTGRIDGTGMRRLFSQRSAFCLVLDRD